MINDNADKQFSQEVQIEFFFNHSILYLRVRVVIGYLETTILIDYGDKQFLRKSSSKLSEYLRETIIVHSIIKDPVIEFF